MPHPSRRDLLRAAPLVAAAPWLVGRTFAQPPAVPQNTTFNGMIVRMQEPQNLEMPFGSLSDCVNSAIAGRIVRDESLWRA